MEAIRTPVSPEDKYIEIIFSALKSCANNRIYNTSEFFASVRVLESFMEQYKDDDYRKAMKKIDEWKTIESNKVGADKQESDLEYNHRMFTELAKLIQRSGFTPPVVMDAVITSDDMGELNGSNVSGKGKPNK